MSEMEEGRKTAEDLLEKRSSQQSARLGSSGKLVGEWVCDADVFILGHFQGKIDSENHDIQIDKGAKVKADIQGKNIAVLGEVTGNITASGKILIGEEAKMIGNLSAPQIAIKEGAKFKGSVLMVPLNK